MEIIELTNNYMTVNMTSNQNSLVYWYLGCEGIYYSYDEIVTKINTKYGKITQNGKVDPYTQQTYEYYNNRLGSMESDLEITEYFRTRLQNDCGFHIYSVTTVNKN